MKRNTAITLSLCLALGVTTVSEAEAGRRNDNKRLSKNRTEMPAEMREAHRFDLLPTMEFTTGVLRRDGISGWRVGEYQLQMSRESVVTGPDGERTVLQEGSRVLVMGPRFGDTYVGWNVRLVGHDQPGNSLSTDVVKKPSDASSDVGEIVSAPY
jgi:hypothetical protein